MLDLEIEFTEWREDINWPNGSVAEDILFIRATCGYWVYTMPIFVETQGMIDEMRLLLARKIVAGIGALN